MSYSTLSMGLRPARVVVVFDGGDRWTYWARRALHLCGRVWGGQGFALVPHRAGKVEPVLLRACRAYDPDFVVVFPRTVAELERLEQGWFRITGQDGKLLTGEEREQMLVMAADNEVFDPFDELARDLVAGACSPYRMRYDDDSTMEDVAVMRGTEDDHFLDAMQVPGAEQGPVLACRPEWDGLLGVAVASHAGIIESPHADASEPVLSEESLQQLKSWLAGAPFVAAPIEAVWFPSAATGVNTKEISTAHDRTMSGLVPVSTGVDVGSTGLAVVGDTPEDFSLARLWRLVFGTGVWLPSVLVDETEPLSFGIVAGLAEMLRGVARRSGALTLTSLSRAADHVEQLRKYLWEPVVTAAGVGSQRDYARHFHATSSTELPWRQPVTTHLAVDQQFETYLSIPSMLSESGTRSMVAPLPAPIITRPDLASHPNLTWHVDISWRPNNMVRGRGLNGTEVFTSDTGRYLTWGRSGRGGVSYQSRRFDFVRAGIPTLNRLARPALKDLSLTDWIAAMCRDHQVDTRLSDAGQRTALLTRMIGDRRTFVDLFAGPMLPALRALLPASSSSRTAYPKKDGVVLSAGEGVLSFDGFCARTDGLDRPQIRSRLDAALHAGVLRRGLVLQCPICEQKQFQTLNKLGQQWTCTRCDANADLAQTAWKMPNDEPTWYYDLHPVGRHMLRDHGEAPALLSAYLATQRDQHATYHDIEEIVFVRAGQPQVEIDLIAYYSDVLIVAECKSAGQLSRDRRKSREEISKKCQAAAWLKADQIIFATSTDSWTSSTINQITEVVASFDWGPLDPPSLRLITGLSVDTSTINDVLFPMPREVR